MKPSLQTAALAAVLGVVAAGCSGGGKHVANASAKPSTNPYVASLAYARCLRDHGVPHPDPNRHGDFSLSPADERRLRAVPKKKRNAAMRTCFHNLAGLNNQPLSERAHRKAIAVLLQLKRCMRGFGYELGPPIVRNMSFGRAMFGFAGATRASAAQRRANFVCERRVGLARKLSRIIAEDRRSPGGV